MSKKDNRTEEVFPFLRMPTDNLTMGYVPSYEILNVYLDQHYKQQKH